jgi:hypothetical protein
MPVERSRWITGAAVLLGYSLALNVMSLDGGAGSLARPAELFGTQQSWTMFAPAPTRLDGWFVVAARGVDGEVIDRLTGRRVEWSPPKDFREGIRTTRELVYMRRLLVDDARRASFAAARCDERTANVAVYFVPVEAGRVYAPELLVAHDCKRRARLQGSEHYLLLPE